MTKQQTRKAERLNEWVLTLDQGTSSSRVLAINSQGEVVAQSKRPLETIRPQAGWAEWEAEILLKSQLEALEEVLAQVALAEASPIALSVASQRSTVVLWDKETGEALTSVLSWQDGRAKQEAEAVSIDQATIHQATGLYKTPFYSAAKITWAIKHIPAVSKAAAQNRLCIGPVASYLIWHLTDGKVFACDPTLAQRTLLFNIQKWDWDEQLLQAFGVQKNWLPEIKQTQADYGYYKCGKWQIPITVCVGDQQAALCAMRVDREQTCINYGTGAFFMRHTGPQCHLLPGILTSVGVTTGKQERAYLLEGPVNACATVFSWLQSIGFNFSMEDLDKLCQKSKSPIWFLPALGGLGAPYWDFKVSPVMGGFSPYSTLPDVLAGAVQGITLLLADIVFYIEKAGLTNPTIKVMGGLSKSQSLLQFQADILQRPLIPCQESESTCLGAAMLAAQQLGWSVEAWHTGTVLPAVTPQITPQQAQERYRYWQHFVTQCRSSVKEKSIGI